MFYFYSLIDKKKCSKSTVLLKRAPFLGEAGSMTENWLIGTANKCFSIRLVPKSEFCMTAASRSTSGGNHTTAILNLPSRNRFSFLLAMN